MHLCVKNLNEEKYKQFENEELELRGRGKVSPALSGKSKEVS